MRGGYFVEAEAGEVGITELEHFRPQREVSPVTAYVAELSQGDEEPPSGSPG